MTGNSRLKVFHRKTRPRRSEDGITMIELMIAGVVMIVGFLGIMALITTAIAGNARNRGDSSATLISQMVVEQITNAVREGANTRTVTDCAGNTFTISAVGTTGGSGTSITNGAINFNGLQVTNYSMFYVVCNATGQRASYDVRWNVRLLSASGPSLVTVAARPRGSNGNLQRFAIPVTLRTIVGS
ncbi:MAG: hypothetical protein AB7O65_11270 [Candidatus Korobacteraceae bacterium]